MIRRGGARLFPVALLAAAGAVALLLLASCSRGPPGQASASEAILVRGGGPDPDSLDPQKARGFEAQSILRDLCEGLTTLDKKAGVAPGVARSWSASLDGLTYTFDLRREARWSNGDPVVAADFVAALRRLVDPATGSAYARYIDVIANASDIVAGSKSVDALGVAAPDDRTVIITLATPAARQACAAISPANPNRSQHCSIGACVSFRSRLAPSRLLEPRSPVILARPK